MIQAGRPSTATKHPIETCNLILQYLNRGNPWISNDIWPQKKDLIFHSVSTQIIRNQWFSSSMLKYENYRTQAYLQLELLKKVPELFRKYIQYPDTLDIPLLHYNLIVFLVEAPWTFQICLIRILNRGVYNG